MMLSTDSCGSVRGRSSLGRCSRVGLAGLLFAHGCVPSRWVGRLVVTGQLPFSSVVFCLLAEHRSCARRSRGNPKGKQWMGCGRK
jgi:hypothetical protein